MRATIRDVAKKANVSLMTVSRVANKKGNISKATATKVLKAIKDFFIENCIVFLLRRKFSVYLSLDLFLAR